MKWRCRRFGTLCLDVLVIRVFWSSMHLRKTVTSAAIVYHMAKQGQGQLGQTFNTSHMRHPRRSIVVVVVFGGVLGENLGFSMGMAVIWWSVFWGISSDAWNVISGGK
ncbi:hypothetical protein Leryth_025698 [Lithospermum erythrorhizon]|nr:hypothetical protein Leryth_025698 [Lithospermum erythrorhizon]